MMTSSRCGVGGDPQRLLHLRLRARVRRFVELLRQQRRHAWCRHVHRDYIFRFRYPITIHGAGLGPAICKVLPKGPASTRGGHCRPHRPNCLGLVTPSARRAGLHATSRCGVGNCNNSCGAVSIPGRQIHRERVAVPAPQYRPERGPDVLRRTPRRPSAPPSSTNRNVQVCGVSGGAVQVEDTAGAVVGRTFDHNAATQRGGARPPATGPR